MEEQFIQMIPRKSTKQQITEIVLAEIPEHLRDKDVTIDELVFRWWQTGRQDGLRLSDAGNDAFKLAEIEYFDFEFKQDKPQSWHSFLLEINKKMKCPFYLGKDKKPYIRLYDSKIAMLLTLYGSLNDYLESIKVK